jgi:basic amino acid/polyamine antiporter, APA family
MGTKISVSTAIIIGMNAMIGAGIFTIASLLASNVGPAGILTYLFAFAAVWFMAKSIARTAFLFPQEGSFYIYAKQVGGHYLGLISAGMYLIGLLIAMGLLCKFAGVYLHQMFPGQSAETLGVVSLLIVILLNLLGIQLSAIGQYILIGCTVFPLISITALCLTKVSLSNFTPFMPFGPLSIIEGTKVAVFGFFGFECTASLFNVVKDPEKNVPKALTYALLFVGIIYGAFIGSIILSIPAGIFQANSSITIPEALLAVFPDKPGLISFINLSIVSAIIGSVHAMVWSASELLLSYLKHLRLPAIQQAVVTKKITNKHAVLFCGAVIFTSCVSVTNVGIFFSLIDTVVIFTYITALLPLLFIKSEWKSGQNITTILGLITACTIFVVALTNLIKHFV